MPKKTLVYTISAVSCHVGKYLYKRLLWNSRCCWHGFGYWCCLEAQCQYNSPPPNRWLYSLGVCLRQSIFKGQKTIINYFCKSASAGSFFRVVWDDPVSLQLSGNLKVLTSPPPGSGSVMAAILNIMDKFKLDENSQQDPVTYHRFESHSIGNSDLGGSWC